MLRPLRTRLSFLTTQIGSVARPVFFMGLLLAISVHVLGSLWFAAGDTPNGWVIAEGLHESPLTRQYTRSLQHLLPCHFHMFSHGESHVRLDVKKDKGRSRELSIDQLAISQINIKPTNGSTVGPSGRSLEWALSKLPPSSLRLTVELSTPLERWLGILIASVFQT